MMNHCAKKLLGLAFALALCLAVGETALAAEAPEFADVPAALPVEAVERGNTVLVAKEGCLDENGVIKDLSAAEERQVTLGRNDDEYIEIVDGLEEGEVVLALSPQGSSLMSAMGMG